MTLTIWTPAQAAAIAARRRTLVTAAAGSGKTSVLTELVATALQSREVAPAEVCAVTFTEKAAQEMRERIAARLTQMGERDLLGDLELARIGTIHSLCSTILRAHGAAVGVDPAVQQLDEAQMAWIIREATRAAIERRSGDDDVHWLRARSGDERIETMLRDIYRIAVQGDGGATLVEAADAIALLDPKSGESIVSAPEAQRAVRGLTSLWREFSACVTEHKHALGRISFDDLERLAVEATRVSQVRTSLQARWSMVLVDEFQDTNARQYELLDAIGGDRLFMVGDEWQSIYRFRGADIEVFRARRADAADGAILPMRENFRSDQPVLDVVNRIFEHERLFGERYEQVHPGTDRQRAAAAPAVELLVVPLDHVAGAVEITGSNRRMREALRVAERIAQLVESGEAEPSDIAVLYARGTGADLYEQAIAAWGLPVLRAASRGYYDQRDVRDVLALLALVRNPGDDYAALSVLAGPIGALEWSELAQLKAAAVEGGTSLLTAAASSTLPGATRVAAVHAGLAGCARTSSLVELVAQATATTELEVGAALLHDGSIRVANLRRLTELAASAEQVGVRDAAGFLEFVDAQRRDARVGEASIADDASGAIRMMTVHAAKGLEFPHVFVIEAASAGGSPSDRYPTPKVDGEGVVHVALPSRDGKGVRTLALEELVDRDKQAMHEESLRLWYVAMTRAQHHLYISGRWSFEPLKRGGPSAVSGPLGWLQETLGLDEFLGGEGRSYPALDGLIRVDTHPARATPRAVWTLPEARATMATPLVLPPVVSRADSDDSPDPHALRSALRDAVSSARSDEWRQLTGTRIHDAVARLLDAARGGVAVEALLDPEQGPWLTDAVRKRLEPVVAAPVLQRLIALEARSEVPYVAGRGERVVSRVVPGVEVVASVAAVDSGRIDALAILRDGAWWVVDWKTTLAADPNACWLEHGEQLTRYARTAMATGAPYAVVTLVPLDRPAQSLSWLLDDSMHDARTAPALVDLPGAAGS